MSSTTSTREKLAAELAAAKLEIETAKGNAEAIVVVYRTDAKAAQARTKEVVEAAQVRTNWVAEHAKCHSQRETLEQIHALGFNLVAVIESAKKLEAEAKEFSFTNDDDSRSMSGSGSGEDPESKDVAPE